MREPQPLTILDIGLPGLNGFEPLFKRLHDIAHAKGGIEVPMLFLTARIDEIDRVVGLELGTDGYIAKPFSPRELVARVRTILRRSVRASAPQSMAHPNPAVENAPQPFLVDETRYRIRDYGCIPDLSRDDYGLLRLPVQRPGRVHTCDESMNRVQVDPGNTFDRTVDAHIKTLRGGFREMHCWTMSSPVCAVPRQRSRYYRPRAGKSLSALLFARAAEQRQEKHGARSGVREGDRHALDTPMGLKEIRFSTHAIKVKPNDGDRHAEVVVADSTADRDFVLDHRLAGSRRNRFPRRAPASRRSISSHSAWASPSSP